MFKNSAAFRYHALSFRQGSVECDDVHWREIELPRLSPVINVRLDLPSSTARDTGQVKSLLVQFMHPALWTAVVQIASINFLLSGDNVVAIALACRELSPGERRLGIVLGTGIAVALTIFFAGVVSILMLIPYVKLIGGLALLYIAYKLDPPGDSDRSANPGTSGSLWKAARIIAIANIVMSFDNVIAIAAAANGNVPAIVVGLAISIPLVVSAARVLVVLLNRFPILVWAGAGLLGWIAGQAIATDPAVEACVKNHLGVPAARNIALALSLAGALFIVLSHWWRQRRSLSARH